MYQGHNFEAFGEHVDKYGYCADEQGKKHISGGDDHCAYIRQER